MIRAKKLIVMSLVASFVWQGIGLYYVQSLFNKKHFQPSIEVSNQALDATVVVAVPGVGMGAGAVIDSRGYVITCHHVVVGALDHHVQVRFRAERKPRIGIVILQDKRRDLALIKLTSYPRHMYVLPIAIKNPPIGELVMTIGHPFGVLWTVGYGIISNYCDYRGYPASKEAFFLQTTALMHPGNSGGPLLNLQGEIIGISSRVVVVTNPMYTSVEMNRAISTSIIHEFLNIARHRYMLAPTR